MEPSRRKPFNNDAGYVCSRKCPDGGHVVVYDRKNGGDWIDGSERWVVAKYNGERLNQGLLDMPTKTQAVHLMKDTAGGLNDWYDDF